ncbi:hypothetical protein [Carnobacterium funditum]|uniref:hypothetical protein n=1 Tax=Carnobacterium funditum TaxID=2752 RepID=UPI0005568EF1|nr:hypothetical protein [Carnobacterium funditum]
MSEVTAMSVNINVYQGMDFYADVFQVENSERMTYDENTLDSDVVAFNNDFNRYDKLKENGQVEIEKMTKDFSQFVIHEIL